MLPSSVRHRIEEFESVEVLPDYASAMAIKEIDHQMIGGGTVSSAFAKVLAYGFWFWFFCTLIH
jgi:hypothetical protein